MTDPDEAIEYGEETIRIIDDDLSDGALAKAATFFESVRDKTRSIIETVEERGEVTRAQSNALENMREGVEKWVH